MRRYYFHFLAGLVSLAFFVELGIYVRTGPTPIDNSVALWMSLHRPDWVANLATVISSATSPAVVAFGAVILLLFQNYWNRAWQLADFIPLFIVATGGVGATLMSSTFDRARPVSSLATFFDFSPSYPSLRILLIVAAGGASLFIFAKGRGVIVLTTILVAGVAGFADLILEEHWITDMLGSVLLAMGVILLWASLDLFLMRKEREEI